MDALTALVGNNPWLLALILLWVLPWKGVALWKAAMREDKWWFIALFIINTFGILDIYYVFFASKRPYSFEGSDQFDEDMLGTDVVFDRDAVEEVEDGSESEAVDEEPEGVPHEHASEALDDKSLEKEKVETKE